MSLEDQSDLAKRIAMEDHLLKAHGDVPLLIAMDRLSWPVGDPRRNGRLQKGAAMFVEWYGQKEKTEKNIEVISGTVLLRKDFSGYINELKRSTTTKKE